VALTGRQKAAMLLMSLDSVSAAELLKDVDADVIEELAVELAYLDAAGYRESDQIAEVSRQFYQALQSEGAFHLKTFLNTVLKDKVGEEKIGQLLIQIQDMLQKRDPFISIRSADPQILASVLESEHPQAAAVVLSELSARKSSEVLGFLDEGIRFNAVSRMIGADAVNAEAKSRIAQMVGKRLEVLAAARGGAAQAGPEQSLRKIAVILRNLGKELRDGLLGAVKEKDSEVSAKIADMMILWEDIPQVADRTLQEALRSVDSSKLALALFKADEAVIEKIKANISERAAAAIDEETSLMSAPKKDDIRQAREEIVKILREMNEKGELSFVEE